MQLHAPCDLIQLSPNFGSQSGLSGSFPVSWGGAIGAWIWQSEYFWAFGTAPGTPNTLLGIIAMLAHFYKVIPASSQRELSIDHGDSTLPLILIWKVYRFGVPVVKNSVLSLLSWIVIKNRYGLSFTLHSLRLFLRRKPVRTKACFVKLF